MFQAEYGSFKKINFLAICAAVVYFPGMRNIYFIKSREEYVSHTFKKNLFKMKNSKNDFPLVWSKTKAPTASRPVVMTRRWQTAGRWGSWGCSHTCTSSESAHGEQLGLELAPGLAFCFQQDQLSGWGPSGFAQTPHAFNWARGPVGGWQPWFCEPFPWDGEGEGASAQHHHPLSPSLLHKLRAFPVKQVSLRKPREWGFLSYFSSGSVCVPPGNGFFPHQVPLLAPETAQQNSR